MVRPVRRAPRVGRGLGVGG
ncbi:hypothetical protein STRTUCAR8_06186, partial [Streptomyces turgidiscabies Car8]